ncbi:hypothetical protein BGZ83_008765 [Gryganskiella cystojenkinii]|nr:hypothetical protein BGZ83_008765 [Gryganskiella cystojenkinii]
MWKRIQDHGICQNPRELQCGLALSAHSNDNNNKLWSELSSSTALLDRLSTLPDLQILGINSRRLVLSDSAATYQKLKLEHGLERLATLKALQVLRFKEGTNEEVDLQDAQWMIED